MQSNQSVEQLNRKGIQRLQSGKQLNPSVVQRLRVVAQLNRADVQMTAAMWTGDKVGINLGFAAADILKLIRISQLHTQILNYY